MIKFIKSSKKYIIIDWEELIDKESNALYKIGEFLKQHNYRVENKKSEISKFYNQINTNILEFHQHNFRSGHAQMIDFWFPKTY